MAQKLCLLFIKIKLHKLLIRKNVLQVIRQGFSYSAYRKSVERPFQMLRNVQLKTWTVQHGHKILINIPFVKKLVNMTTKSCKSDILDFVEKIFLRVSKCDMTYIKEIKLFLDNKPFFVFFM